MDHRGGGFPEAHHVRRLQQPDFGGRGHAPHLPLRRQIAQNRRETPDFSGEIHGFLDQVQRRVLQTAQGDVTRGKELFIFQRRKL